jgi:hypothetical protein
MAFGFLPHADSSVKIFFVKLGPKLKVVGGYFEPICKLKMCILKKN